MKNYNAKFKMRRKKLFFIFDLCFCFFIFNFLFPPPAEAAYFYLEPKTHTASVGTEFKVELKINTEGEETTSADVLLLFDQDVLEVTDVTAADFYPQNFKNISADKVYIGGAVESAAESKNGDALLSTITFKGKTAGTTVARFDCTPGKTSDSNISKNDDEATDILDCTKLVNGTYTIGAGGTHPTFGPTCSPSPQPSPTGELPAAGIVAPSIFLLGIGALLTTLGFLFTL